MFFLGLACRASCTPVRMTFWICSACAGDLGTGLFYLVSRQIGLGADSVQVTTADYGTRFMVVAGLLNIIAAVDAPQSLYRQEKVMFSPSHFSAVLLFALFASTVFAITQRSTPKTMFRYGAWCFALFYRIGDCVELVMFLLAR